MQNVSFAIGSFDINQGVNLEFDKIGCVLETDFRKMPMDDTEVVPPV